jgi:hypothetical protein
MTQVVRIFSQHIVPDIKGELEQPNTLHLPFRSLCHLQQHIVSFHVRDKDGHDSEHFALNEWQSTCAMVLRTNLEPNAFAVDVHQFPLVIDAHRCDESRGEDLLSKLQHQTCLANPCIRDMRLTRNDCQKHFHHLAIATSRVDTLACMARTLRATNALGAILAQALTAITNEKRLDTVVVVLV